MELNLNKGDYIFIKSPERIYDVIQICDIYKNEENKSIYKVNALRRKTNTWYISEDIILGKVEIFDNDCDSVWELLNK